MIPLDTSRTTQVYAEYVKAKKIKYLAVDVRNRIDINVDGEVSLIANFAAIHREPGHDNYEYFETNIQGAENVCEWAENVNCEKIIFTSSIAPYGPTESELNETSVPVPVSSYGASKLVAEKIHIGWKNKNVKSRRLVIVRPGVVFGAGEMGNVTRLINAIIGRYFLYMGNQKTRKAGVYVKELCNAMWWALDTKAGKEHVLFNMTMNPGPTIEEYVSTTCEVAEITRFVPSVPLAVLYPISYVLEAFSKILRVQQPVSPIRIKKLVRSNNILPQYLVAQDYEYNYTLKSAMADWKKDKPSEWY